jgi:hypothetical protein
LYKNYDAVVWWATPVEIAGALARLMRMKQLDSTDWAKASKLTKSLADSWSVIQPSDALRATSIQLVDRYDLRAAALLSGFNARQNVVASDRLKMLSRRKPNASKA